MAKQTKKGLKNHVTLGSKKPRKSMLSNEDWLYVLSVIAEKNPASLDFVKQRLEKQIEEEIDNVLDSVDVAEVIKQARKRYLEGK